MKKVFFILASIAMVAMVCSCKKDTKKGGKTGGGDEPTAAAIVIDGNFSDWTVAGIAKTETPGEELQYGLALKMMGAADEDNIYFYFEVKLAEGITAAPFDIFLNSDCDPATGFISWIWDKTACGWDYLIETEAGFLKKEGEKFVLADFADANLYRAKVWKDNDGVQLDGWATEPVKAEQEKLTNKDFVDVKGKVQDGIAYFELSIPRSVVNANKKGTLGVGITTSNQDWSTVGILPLDETGTGVAGFLDIALP